MIVASSADTLAPALPEQIQAFTWLTTANKYLVPIGGATHFSAIASSPNEAVVLPPFVVGTNPTLVHQYMKALNVAFFKTHLMARQEYRSYLRTDYAQAISQMPVLLALVKTLNASDLSKNLADRLLFESILLLPIFTSLSLLGFGNQQKSSLSSNILLRRANFT